ncbi:FxLD family lanthipeptide [Streptomonospora sp. S1-112]|uniref:FxLD family lantipeptide n=2 Tax=Streptomonospora TaxID=104204 RepID=A0A853BHW9_9ACTN|nr:MULTISPECIES: FxLD family lanthipeptide [Streptomonospora]MBV2364127.1 FxLD family lanthipeptide [Streptomonospora nanhaiensis]MBX9388477.1 FxLD family lanthipeptide [Streptomonospora nanhaiensis]MDA0565196.1 FxLD family lanthipeptide [Streptomonospora mangrovi]NYI95078.1 FxLD family lantipeptide [Streptomonospora nanhaiensis]
MSTLTAAPTADGLVALSRDRTLGDDAFDLDLRVEVPVVDEPLWSMTNDGCGSTCQSACTQSCTNSGGGG